MQNGVRTLEPGSFALVMATGILSIGLFRVVPGLSAALLWVAALCYVVLVGAHIGRLARYHAEVGADVANPVRGFGFFTFVAGTDVLGTRLAQGGNLRLAVGLLVVGVLAWVALGYLVPWKSAVHQDNRSRLEQVNGTWFVWVVGSQSVAVLAATLQPLVDSMRQLLAVVAVLAWSAGLFLYMTVGGLVVMRLLLHPFRPADLIPAYWVAMGATAISVVAGSRIRRLSDTRMIDNMHDLIAGTDVVFWGFGTWLIPALVAGGWWRHVRHRVPLRYQSGLWSVVFPLGMYSVATRTLGTTEEIPLVRAVGEIGIWLALAVWAIVFIAMLVRIGRTLAPDFSHPKGL